MFFEKVSFCIIIPIIIALQSFLRSIISRLPLVVFFDFEDGDVKEVTIMELYEDHAAFSFNELFAIFQNRLQRMQRPRPKVKKRSKFWLVLTSAGGKVADKALEVIFSKIAEKLTNGH